MDLVASVRAAKNKDESLSVQGVIKQHSYFPYHSKTLAEIIYVPLLTIHNHTDSVDNLLIV